MKFPGASTVLCVVKIGIVAAGVAKAESAGLFGVDSGEKLALQNLRNGWINPEDLAPMPQCVFQQDPSAWLNAMTKCTSKRCTSHFGAICTHHQWLTQVSCLSSSFSPEVVKAYLPRCSQSVLAKAQLFQWIHHLTGRNWLVEVGDAHGLQSLSPSSLVKGYASVDVVDRAPACLVDSISSSSSDSFQYVTAYCGFTGTTQHTGNAARPWEYSERKHSMVALDSETVGYNLTGRSIGNGNYFDKQCLCSAFTISSGEESCSDQGALDLTKERLWVNATCGPKYLPENWSNDLKTTRSAYIATQKWNWPKCVKDMPERILDLSNQCETEACEVDAKGYCIVVPAVERSCFCRKIEYGSCGGLCQKFETRIDYVNWLHDLCGSVPDWHGLPKDWRRLAVPTHPDLVPWQWTFKPSQETKETCLSAEWKLGFVVLANIAISLAIFVVWRKGKAGSATNEPCPPYPQCWFSKAILIASCTIFANALIALIIQHSPGNGGVPVVELLLLLSSIPRPTWLMILLLGASPNRSNNPLAAQSFLMAEVIVQAFGSYNLFTTVKYGWQHDFYMGSMERLEEAAPAKLMYAGAMLWLVVITVALVLLLQAIWPEQRSPYPASYTEKRLVYTLLKHFPWLQENFSLAGIDDRKALESTRLTCDEAGHHTTYGSMSIPRRDIPIPCVAYIMGFAVTVAVVLLLWILQWLFWSGLIGLTEQDICLPYLGVLTAVWAIFNILGVVGGLD